MKRNMKKIANEIQGRIPNGYALSYGECVELSQLIDSEKEYDAICIAFNYGFALAQRYEKNRRKRGATA